MCSNRWVVFMPTSWLEAQLAEKKTEPNSGLGRAITYLLRHWKGLTAVLREAGAPLDNNICERALNVLCCIVRMRCFIKRCTAPR